LAVHTAAGVYDPVKVFICPSRFMKEKMTAAGVYPERLRQVSHFVDAAGIALKSGPGGGIVVAGRLSTEKGVDVLVEAVGRLDGDVVLDVAGEGPERLSLEALARERAPGQVRFWGRLPKPELFSLLRQSAVLSLPSRCYENQPVTILEAFASGVPVVGSDLGGIPELIETGVHGQVVPADDADALANALRSVLAEPERAFAMGRAARRFVEDEFSCEKHLARLDALYDEAGCTSVKPAV
jgi:glycosyltransferase involved in cell wall biosynthesis